MSENVVSLTPLLNFDSEIELLKLSEKLCLRRAEDNELSNLLDKLTRDITNYLPLLEAKFVLEDKIEPLSYKRMIEIILALRLLKAGDVHVLGTFHLRRMGVSLGRYEELDRFFFPESIYGLKKAETSYFTQLWKKVQDAGSRTYLQYPLHKFMEAYDRLSFDDRIVEYMIAFESLVFYGRDRAIEPAGEVMGISIGMLVGNNQKERSRIKKTLVEAYKLRNAKVHGNVKRLESWKRDMRQLSTEVEECLRRSLRKLVEE